MTSFKLITWYTFTSQQHKFINLRTHQLLIIALLSQTHTIPTASKTLNPNQFSTLLLVAELFVSVNGELFVSSSFAAEEVLLDAVPLELVLSAAILVVSVVVLESLLLPEEADGLCVVVKVLPAEFVVVTTWPTAVAVVVYVDFRVTVLSLESVVVYVLIAPGSVVVLVYVEPSLSVVTMMTGITPVKPLEGLAIDTEVTVDPEPDSVIVFSMVTGYTMARVVPPCVVVTVVVVTNTDRDCTAVVALEPPLAEAPSIVTVCVVVTCIARLLAWFSAFCIADSGIGAPAMSHASCSGINNRLLSRLLSHWLCMQVISSGRKLSADARHKQVTSVTSQLPS